MLGRLYEQDKYERKEFDQKFRDRQEGGNKLTELQLYKFIQDNEIEISWCGDTYLNIWIDGKEMEELAALMNRCDADDGGIDCKLQNGGHIVLNLLDICSAYGINPENILPKDY